MIRIFVVDDHTLVRQGISSLLESTEGMTIVGEASTGMEAVAKCRSCMPDVVIMDSAMPDMNGAQATERILEECPSARVLGVSMHAEPCFVERMLAAGAAGYVLKSSPLSDLQAAVLAVSAGHSFLSPAVTDTVLKQYMRQSGKPQEAVSLSLSLRDREVLQLVAEGKTSKDIAEMLSLSVRTVEKYRLQIMKRLELESTAALIKYAIKEGFSSLDF